MTHRQTGSRQHLWTFAEAFYDENPNYHSDYNCPCTKTHYNWHYQLLSFIHNSYFCDTGNPGSGWDGGTTYYSDDPLWDGVGCDAKRQSIDSLTTLLGSSPNCLRPPQLMLKYISAL